MTNWIVSLIPKQLEELVLGFVGFTFNFSSSLVPCLSAMVTRCGQKFEGTSLPNSQLFKLFGYIFFSFPLWAQINLSETNLDDMAQSFVLETKRIVIAPHDFAFNPSIIPWNGGLLLSYRLEHPKEKPVNRYGFIWLDEQFDPIGEPYVFHLENLKKGDYTANDIRLIGVGEDLYIVYNQCTKINIFSKKVPRLYIRKVLFDGVNFSFSEPLLLYFKGMDKNKYEKNWMPFIYQDNLYFVYSISPHRILKPNLKTGECEFVYRTFPNINWDFGELRGGSPAIISGGEYLAFFHSMVDAASMHSEGKKTLHYFMGAYTFSSEPPFQITKISPQPIVSKGFYEGKHRRVEWGEPRRVIYPAGFIQDENYVWVAYGRNDCEAWIAKIDKQGLIDSLVPVSSN